MMSNVYTINEDVSDDEVKYIKANVDDSVSINIWPTDDNILPSDIDAAIYIVRSTSTSLEDSRANKCVASTIRIVCIYTEDLHGISILAQQFCSAKVSTGLVGLMSALSGDINIQENPDGSIASKTDTSHNKC